MPNSQRYHVKLYLSNDEDMDVSPDLRGKFWHISTGLL